MKTLLSSFFIAFFLSMSAQDTCHYTLRFPSDASQLSAMQVTSLDSLLTMLDGYSNASLFYIEGHTDNVGDRSYNVKLSEKRCRSVKKFLMKRGVDEKRISFERFAFDLPVASNETDAGRADNRRTSLTIVTKLPAPKWKVPAQVFAIDPKRETVLTTRNGCKVSIPENAFEVPEPNLFPGKVKIEVTEYNNPAQFISSGIPMSYTTSGKVFMYHSEELIGIKAFYRSRSLELRDDVKITLNCRKVDSLYTTGFYKFNLKEQKWFEDEVEESVMELETVQKQVAQEKTESPASAPQTTTALSVTSTATEQNKESESQTEPGNQEQLAIGEAPEELDYLDKIEKAKIDTGGYYGAQKNEKDRDSLAYPCGPHCCDTYLYLRVGKKVRTQGIDLEGLDLSRKYLTDGAADKRYLKPFVDHSPELLSDKKYRHIRLIVKKQFLLKRAVVQFKFDKEKNPELKSLKKIKWIYRFKENEVDYASLEARRFSDIRIVFDLTSASATIKLEENDKVCVLKMRTKDPDHDLEGKIKKYQRIVTPRMLSIYSCFWEFHQNYIAREEKSFSFLLWSNYFNRHLSDMRQRYDSLTRNAEALVRKLNCCAVSAITCTFIPGDGGSDTIVKKLVKQAGPNRLLLIGLGLYNYDQVIPIKDLVRISKPLFKTESGRLINPKECFLILGGINGMIHVNDHSSVPLIANYRNTLFVVDQANRRYKLVLEGNDSIRGHDSVFVMEDITASTQNLKGLETELMLH